MPFGLDDIAMISSIAGGIGQGVSGAMGQGQGVDEQKREYNLNLIRQLTQQLEQGPMRDRLQYNMNARLGQTPQNFQPNTGGMFGMNQPPQQGGINAGQLQQQYNAYTPGAGGFQQGTREQLLRLMGWYPNQQPGQSGYAHGSAPGMAPYVEQYEHGAGSGHERGQTPYQQGMSSRPSLLDRAFHLQPLQPRQRGGV